MWFMATIFLIVGCGLGYAGLYLRRRAEEAARWPVTDGKLERCEVVEKPDVDFINEPSTWGLGLEYSYSVHGRNYRSQRYAFVEMNTYDEREPQRLVDMLRAQEPLRVRYDPRKPSEAVLSAEPPDQIDKLAMTCFVMAGVSVLITLVVCGAG